MARQHLAVSLPPGAMAEGQRFHRARYRHVVALFHHPVYSSGRYSGVMVEGRLPNGQTASAGGSLSPQATAIRALYMPLFRKHHVNLLARDRIPAA